MQWTIRGRIFTLFGHYEVFNEKNELVYDIQGQPSWAGNFQVTNAEGVKVADIRRKVFSFFPTFIVEENGKVIGTIKKEFSFFKPKYNVQFLNWQIQGDFFQLHYNVTTNSGTPVASINQKLFSIPQVFTLNFDNPADGLDVVLLAVAIARVEQEENNQNSNNAAINAANMQ